MHGQGKRTLGTSCPRMISQVAKHVAGNLVSDLVGHLDNTLSEKADSARPR